MRLFSVVTAILVGLLSGCSSSGADPAASAPFQPYMCAPPARPALPATPAGTAQRIAVIGDSYTNGSPEGGTGDKRWTSLVTDELRSHGMNVALDFGAEGGSGYVHRGNRGGVFADKIKSTVQPNDRLIVFFGSRNDSRATQSEMARATCDAFQEAEMAAPGAQLLVIGPPWIDPNPPEYILQARDIIKNRVEGVNARFIDPISDGWFLDRPDLIGSDGVHPTNEGHAYMAERIAPVIEQMLALPAAP